jgi:ATP-binding cassette, subfamily B, bacterial PglK
MNIIIRTIHFIKDILPQKYKVRAVVISILLFINSGLELIGLGAILPLFVVLLEDSVVAKYKWAAWLYKLFHLTDERQLIVILAIVFFIIIGIKNILGLWITKIQSEFSYSLFKLLTLELHELYYKKGYPFFKGINSNVIVRDVRLGAERFAQALVLGILTFLNEIIVLIAIIIGITAYNFKIFLLLIITVLPPFLLFYGWVRKRSIVLGEIKNRIEPIIGKNLFQSIFGFVDIKISGAETVFRKRIEDNLDELVDVNIKTNIYNLAPTRVIETSLMFAIAVIISFGIYYLPSKTDLVKILGLFVLAGYRIMPSVNRMMLAINNLNQNIWVFDVLSPLIGIKKQKLALVKELYFEDTLKLESISFSYPNSEENVLENYSIEIRKGEVVGLIGPSGAGKTTVMNILLGFLKPTKGHYKIDGVTLSEEYEDSFYKKIGYVQQQVYLIDASLAENIAFGCNTYELNEDKINQVLKQASLWDLVQTLPEGIHTMIGENGAKLSGGQRQRVGIARALYFDAEILFFDEATSSLDNQTEKEISESINKLSDGKLTMIIIAHRMSTLEGCDRIIEINSK